MKVMKVMKKIARKIARLVVMGEAEYNGLLARQAAEVEAAREEAKKEGVEAQKAKRLGLYYLETIRADGSRRDRGPVCFGEIPERGWGVDYCSAGPPTGVRGPVRVTAKEAVEKSWLKLDPSAQKFLQELGLL